MIDLFGAKKQARKLAEEAKKLHKVPTNAHPLPHFMKAAKDIKVTVDCNEYDTPPRGGVVYHDTN